MRRLLGMAGLLVIAIAAWAPGAAAWSETLLEHLTDGGAPLSVGLGVSPLRPQIVPPISIPAPGLELQSTAISFDLKLRWPGADVVKSLEPYVVLGPALFVVEPDYVSRMLGTRVDPTLRLGTKAGAGVNWRLGRDVTLFGAYEATTGGGLGPLGAKVSSDSAVSGYDFTYGLRLRY
jgi:hypothetical protein